MERAKLEFKDFFTLVGTAIGVFSLLSAAVGNVFLAALAILVAGVIDFFDGRIARATRPTEFGKHLDSLSDVISFGAAPALLAFVSTEGSVTTAVAAVLFVACGVVRIAWFNLQKEKGVYYGLPLPAAGIIIVLAITLGKLATPIALLATAVLMVSKIRFKKL